MKVDVLIYAGYCAHYTEHLFHFQWAKWVNLAPFYLPSGVTQPGMKVLAAIFASCPLVLLPFGRKYGRLLGGTHGSPGPPQA
jgi:hypothetical protein